MRHFSYPVAALSALLLACGPDGGSGTLDPAVAAVTEVGQCQSQITQLREITAAPTTTFASEKDRVGLLGKLDASVRALSAGKSSDAVEKLTNFRDKVTTLELQGKVGPESTQLISGADAAIVCINSL